MDNKKIHIIGASTLPVSRTTQLVQYSREAFPTLDIIQHPIDRTENSGVIADITGSPSSKIVFFDPENRIEDLQLLGTIRKTRKDIFLVGFHETDIGDADAQYMDGLGLLKRTSSNLIHSHNTQTGLSMIVAPEEARYHEGTDTSAVLRNLVDMTKHRSHLTFTRSNVISAEGVPWDSPLVYPALRTVVDFCIEASAYKPFMGSTAGHFAVRLDDQTFLTSKRKTDFNRLREVGLVKVTTDGPDNVLAYGGKPSVGGQSQRIIFRENPGLDCIVHFHCPLRESSDIPIMSQREFECGSHECGQNTANGLKDMGNGIYAVYLDNHGPNIVFNHNTDSQAVIRLIEQNFDLTQKTGGYVDLGTIL